MYTSDVSCICRKIFKVYLFCGMAHEKVNPLSANFTKRSNTFKQFVGNMPTNCLSVFDHFVGLVLKGLKCYTINPFEPSVAFLIETSHLICSANTC